jgi:hypothetical protein
MFFFSGNSAGKQLDLSNIKNVLTAFSLANIGQCKYIRLKIIISRTRMQFSNYGFKNRVKFYIILLLWENGRGG